MEQSKSELRLHSSSAQLNKLADKLIGSAQNMSSEITQAIRESNGFNMVGSKSTKTLPKANQAGRYQDKIKVPNSSKYMADKIIANTTTGSQVNSGPTSEKPK